MRAASLGGRERLLSGHVYLGPLVRARACRATNGIRDAAWFAQYERFEAPTDLGYTIKVINHEEDATGLTIPAPALCAIQDAASKSKLTVGICMLPIPAATNYHVLFHDKATGVALVTEEK